MVLVRVHAVTELWNIYGLLEYLERSLLYIELPSFLIIFRLLIVLMALKMPNMALFS